MDQYDDSIPRARAGHCSVAVSLRFVCDHKLSMGAAMASWLVCSSPDQAARVQALAGVIALCSWARHITLTVPLSTQVYKWVLVNLMLGVALQ